MVKSLEQLNREFMEQIGKKKALSAPVPSAAAFAPSSRKPQKKTGRGGKITIRAADVLLYSAIVFVLLTTVFLNGGTYKKMNLFGYSGFTVLSDSMQRDIPEGSFILVKAVDPGSINVDDIITFTRKKDNTTVTHRVIQIYENYGENGDWGFQTQGIENTAPDCDIVYAGDIIGVVRLAVPGLGAALNLISVNIGIILIAFGALIIITVLTKKILLPDKTERAVRV